MPMSGEPEKLEPQITELRRLAQEAGRPAPEVAVLTMLPLQDRERAVSQARAFAEVGATRLINASRYADAAEFRRGAEILSGSVRDALRT